MILKPTSAGQHKSTRIAAYLYRIPLPVKEVLQLGGDSYPVCPRCGSTVEREYMCFCDRCGQKLGWDIFNFARAVPMPLRRR